MEKRRIPTYPIPAASQDRSSHYIYDFEICSEYEELKRVLGYINRCGYELICVTQDSRDFFTIFFKRRRCG